MTGTATEDGTPVALDPLANASDVDARTALSVVDIPDTLPAGVTYDSEAGTFTLDPSNAAYQSLAEGEQIVVEVSYNVSDGIVTTPASVSWTVTGTADGPVANNDTAEMNENDVLFVDVLANDAQGATSKLLKSLGNVTIDGPDDVVLGTPAIVIENNQIRVTPGTAFDALATGETATITVPYTMQTGAGEVLTATATITVTGTNDAPYFELLPSGMILLARCNNRASAVSTRCNSRPKVQARAKSKRSSASMQALLMRWNRIRRTVRLSRSTSRWPLGNRFHFLGPSPRPNTRPLTIMPSSRSPRTSPKSYRTFSPSGTARTTASFIHRAAAIHLYGDGSRRISLRHRRNE